MKLLGLSSFALGTGLALCCHAFAADTKIGYINKMGDHPWFVAEVAGAKAAAESGGADFVSQDVQFNADLTVTTLDTMIGDGVKGIAIVVPDKGLGPVVAQKAKDAGIPLIAVDDDIYFKDGSPVPYVGLDAYSIGKQVGTELAKLYKSEGWSDKEVRIASIEDRKADTCMKRNKGAEEAFLAATPDFDPAKIIRVAYDNTMVNSIDVMTTTLTAHPQVTNWIFYSCNDDGVLGAARALENSGYTARPGHGHRHRWQPCLRRVWQRQAFGLPRHNVAQLRQSRAHRRRTAACLDQGRRAAAREDLQRSRADYRRKLRKRLQGQAVQVSLLWTRRRRS